MANPSPAYDPQFSQFYNDPSAFNAPPRGRGAPPSSGGVFGQMTNPQNIPLDMLAVSSGGLPISLLMGMFEDEPSWRAYVSELGNYVWADPASKNPVPIANVPGAPLSPNKEYRQMAGQIQAIQDLFPYFSKTLAGQIIPQQQAQLAAAQATSDPYAQLMLDMYKKFGPQMNDIGNEINRTNMMAQAANERDVIQGPGGELTRAAMQLSREQDPEFYKTREAASGRLGDLMSSIDLTGELSPTEREEIRKGLVREGTQRGTTNAPSATETVSNAMTYGNAGTARKLQAQSALASAIGVANQFLPASRSGVDVFQVATGRPSGPNPGAGYFPGVNRGGSETFNTIAGLGNNMSGNISSQQMNNANIESQKKDWLDQFVQFSQGFGNMTSSLGALGGMAGMGCWIAQEVYGKNNIRWHLFRNWLMNKAPVWFKDLYMRYGKQFAEYIKDKPLLKLEIRNWMDERINYVR